MQYELLQSDCPMQVHMRQRREGMMIVTDDDDAAVPR
jgi:hypothetical protein